MEESKKKEKVMDVRLPRSISPIHYHIKLIPFVNGNLSVHGYTEMTFEVLEDTKNVTLHINGIITRNETVKVIIINIRNKSYFFKLGNFSFYLH